MSTTLTYLDSGHITIVIIIMIEIIIVNDFYPGSSTQPKRGIRFSVKSCIQWNWNLEMLIFEERGKQDTPEKNLSEPSEERKTNLTHSLTQNENRTLLIEHFH